MTNKQFEQVLEWSEKFNMYVSDTYSIADKDTMDLAFSLVKEELQEGIDAVEEKDKVKLFDSCMDTLWVVYRWFQSCGITAELTEKGFDEIYRSNMSKASSTLEDAELTRAKYLKEKGFDSEIVERNGLFYNYSLHESNKGKLLKSITYSEANFSDILKS